MPSLEELRPLVELPVERLEVEYKDCNCSDLRGSEQLAAGGERI